jgi:hypothetical protein
MIRYSCYILGGCCIIGIIMFYALARASGTPEQRLDRGITGMIVITWLFITLDVVVLILLGKEVRRRVLLNQLKIGGAILAFLAIALTISIFLFATCGVAIYTMG